MGKKILEDVIWVFISIFSAEKLGIVDNSWSVELRNNVLSSLV